jgi:hypothetical protein
MRAFRMRSSLKVLVAFAIGLAMVASQVLAAPLTDEQKKVLQDYFSTSASLGSSASEAAGLLNDEKLSDFFEKYSDRLTLLNVASQAASGNTSLALKTALEKAGTTALEKMAKLSPAIAKFSSGLSAVQWAWTGMELVNNWVVEPWRVQSQLDTYTSARNAGDTRENAMLFVKDIGQIRLTALKEFVNVKGEDVLVPGTKDTLKPELEGQLTEFMDQWFEKMYQDKLAEDAKAALLAQAETAKVEVAALEKELLEKLKASPPPGTGSTGGPVSESIAVLLDASGSMDEQGRMDAAKASARQVIGQMKGNVEVALIVFFDCGDIKTVTEFTTDPAPLLAALEPILPSGGTPLAEGITKAKEYLRTSAKGAAKRLVVLTDGDESCSGDLVGAARK